MKSNLYIYNSLTGTKELFIPITDDHVGMYVCGPTLHNEVHLGNLRTFISFDVIYRYLLYLGYKVRYVRNITDVGHLESDADEGEDKISKQARLEQLEPMEIVQKYAVSFRELQRIFNILPPSIEPLATGHIPEQIAMIESLISNGYAYECNGSVYFAVRKYNEKKPYGLLSGRKIDELLHETRDLEGINEKEDPLDFALWKKATEEHIMKWPSPWGMGFPGWHIECSTMGQKYLGKQFDIHGGGMDLKFPHHECEIAQSSGSSGHKPVNYWIHTNMLTVNGTKMSKSKGNSFLPMDLISGKHSLLTRGFSPMVIRFFMMQTHYSSTLDFSNEALIAAEKGYNRLMSAWENLNTLHSDESNLDKKYNEEIDKTITSAYGLMSDDFNTAGVLAILFELAYKINACKDGHIDVNILSTNSIQNMQNIYHDLLTNVMGIQNEKITYTKNDTIQDLMSLIIELRNNARAQKDYALSDTIRDRLKAVGIQLKDGKEEVSWEFCDLE